MTTLEKFESSVNSEGIETVGAISTVGFPFESSVNSEGIETQLIFLFAKRRFESSVNSEGIETISKKDILILCLRAV